MGGVIGDKKSHISTLHTMFRYKVQTTPLKTQNNIYRQKHIRLKLVERMGGGSENVLKCGVRRILQTVPRKEGGSRNAEVK